jgi:hypothetical protein
MIGKNVQLKNYGLCSTVFEQIGNDILANRFLRHLDLSYNSLTNNSASTLV